MNLKIINFKKIKKSISPVVALSLLIVISVSSAVLFNTWYNTYESEIFSNIENIKLNSIDILYLNENTLYIKNSNNFDINFTDIKIDTKNCNINGTLLKNKVNEINLGNCTSGLNKGVKEVVVFTKYGIFSKKLILKTVIFTPTSNNTGYFSGYAYNENLGFISFNGTNYQVKLINNVLTGYAYSENYGYISFNGSNYNVSLKNDVLVGYAYGENIGFINFNNSPLYQVVFNETNLNGYAYSENFGYINFNSSIYIVSYN